MRQGQASLVGLLFGYSDFQVSPGFVRASDCRVQGSFWAPTRCFRIPRVRVLVLHYGQICLCFVVGLVGGDFRVFGDVQISMCLFGFRPFEFMGRSRNPTVFSTAGTAVQDLHGGLAFAIDLSNSWSGILMHFVDFLNFAASVVSIRLIQSDIVAEAVWNTPFGYSNIPFRPAANRPG